MTYPQTVFKGHRPVPILAWLRGQCLKIPYMAVFEDIINTYVSKFSPAYTVSAIDQIDVYYRQSARTNLRPGLH